MRSHSRLCMMAAGLLVVFACPLVMASEPQWWTDQKRLCRLSPNLAYETWKEQNSPCYQDPAPSQTQQTAPAPPPGQDEARDLNQKGLDAYNSSNYDSAAQYFREALDKLPGDPTTQQNLQKAKDQIAAQKRKSEEAFNQDKLRALAQLKGIANRDDFGSDSGLKGVGSTGLVLKGVPNSGDSVGLKTLPDVNADTHVVDARNVPTGLPKAIEAEIPDTPAGNRVRKGFEAILDHDWNVAHAWFQDALNHDPGNAGIQRLIDLAEYTIERARGQHRLVPPSKPAANTSAQDKATLATLDHQLGDRMNADLAKALADFNRNYLPKHPFLTRPLESSVSAPETKPANKAVESSTEPSPEKIKANWQAFFDAIFKKGERYSEVGAVRD